MSAAPGSFFVIRADMSGTDMFRTTRFQQMAALAGIFAVSTMLLLSLIGWRTAESETRRIDGLVADEADKMAAEPLDVLKDLVESRIHGDVNHLHYAGLFDPKGNRVIGNLVAPPEGLPRGGWVRPAACPTPRLESCRAVARLRPDGWLLVVARRGEDPGPVRAEIFAALELAMIPAVLLAIMVGAGMSWRIHQRAKAMRCAAERISQGDLHMRLPVNGGQDEFDRLSGGVNGMLDEIERLLDDSKAISAEIAHDLRTPLTRVRLRLERARRTVGTREDLECAIDNAMGGIDHALAIVSALLRIREVGEGRQRAGFAMVDLAEIVAAIHEFYTPIAEEKRIRFDLENAAVKPLFGDRDLLMEAVGNLVDNAIKFTPEGGSVTLSLIVIRDRPVIRVADTGPGIPAAERAIAFTRFYRSPRRREVDGNGLGLSLVAAITKLHDIKIALNDNHPGCVIDLRFDGAPEWGQISYGD
jgi:signal transduction histidine kinase